MRARILRAFKKAVNKKHGKTIGLAPNMRILDIPRLSTGSLSFDFALGGGAPAGRLIVFWGKKSSGKTTSAIRIAALAQKLCANCLRPVDDLEVVESGYDEESGEIEYEAVATCDCYKKGLFEPVPYPDEYSDREKGTLKQVDVGVLDEKTGEPVLKKDGKPKTKKSTLFKERLKRYEENSYEEYRVAFFDFERSLDLEWARSVGVDTRLLLVVVPGSGEEGVDIYDDLLRTGTVDLFILDSIAAVTPSIEIESSMEDDQRAAAAKLVNKFVRKAIIALNDSWRDFRKVPTQIWTNQERSSMNTNPYAPNEVMPAGQGQKFGASVIVTMWPSKWDRATHDADLKKEFQIEMGKEVRMNFKVTDNKTATAQATGGYVMRVVGARRGKVDEFKYVLDQAMKYGLFREEEEKKKKKWFVGDEEFDKKSSALARLEEPAVFEALKKVLLKKMLDSVNKEE